MGSDSDMPVLAKAADVLEKFDAPYTVHILSAHRTPQEAALFAQNAAADGYGVIIAAAGMAAHLAGAFAANTVLPVIGVPVAASLNGLDALLSTVQMPSGIPVACVAVNGAANAAYLAMEILALSDPDLSAKLLDERERNKTSVLKKDYAAEAKMKELLGGNK